MRPRISRLVAAVHVFLLLGWLLGLAAGQAARSPGQGSWMSQAVRKAALPLGVSQILMQPQNSSIIGNNRVNGNIANPDVPGYGASIAWSPTTTGSPRLIVGNTGIMTMVGGRTVYGAAYVYNSESFSFSLQQVLFPPSALGSSGVNPVSRFGIAICASPNSERSPVLSGSNLWVAQTSSVVTPSDTEMQKNYVVETVYFYSASRQTQGLTRNDYLLQQQIRLTTSISSQFGLSMTSSHGDMTLVVGAPGYPNLPQASPNYVASGPTSGRVYIFQWQTAQQAFTMQAILSASEASNPNEWGFGISVAMSGNVFAVGSMGRSDVTGQPVPGFGNVYIYTLQAPIPGLNGESSALTTQQWVQTIPTMPVSNPMAMSMTGNYLCVGVQLQSTVNVMLTAPVSTRNPKPNFDLRQPIGGGSAKTGMGQIVVATTVDGLLYLYCGQPNANVGAIFMSTAPNSVQLQEMGLQGGLEPGFGTSVVFNNMGNYMFAGNFLNNPHALVISLYYETFGKKAARQRLISNDVQTANSGVFSNYGSTISGQISAAQSIIAVGASIGPTLQGRVYVYTLQKAGGGTPQFSLQAEIVGQQKGSNFGASIATMLSTGNDIAILIGAPSTSGSQIGAYVDIFIASAGPIGILNTATGTQRLLDPRCVPLSNQFSCGANFGGNVVVDGMRIIVGAHNFGIQRGTGRVYVYLADLTATRDRMFSLQQTLVSPAQEFGFGVALALVDVIQNRNTPTIKGAFATQTNTQTTTNVLHVGSMGLPRDQDNWVWPYKQPQGVGMAYIYVNTLAPGVLGQPYSQLQVLENCPIPLTSTQAGTGAPQSLTASMNDMFIGNPWRNEVRFYRYNGRSQYTLQQTLVSPYGPKNWGGFFGSAVFNTRSNRGLLVGSPGNGTVFMYLNKFPVNQVGRFDLQRVLAARPIADMFGQAVTSCGETVVVGAPGANIATIYPLTDIMKLPNAQLSLQPTPSKTTPIIVGTPTPRPQAPVASQAPAANPRPFPVTNPTYLPLGSPTIIPTTTLEEEDPEEEEDTEAPASAPASALSSDHASPGTGLGDGAIAGIVVGVIAVIVLVMVALYCSKRNKEQERLQTAMIKNIIASNDEAAAAPGQFTGNPQSSRRNSRGSAGAFDHHQVYRDSEMGPGGDPRRPSIHQQRPSVSSRPSMSQPHLPPHGHPHPSMNHFGPPPPRGGPGDRQSMNRGSMARGSTHGHSPPHARGSVHHDHL